MTRTITIKRNTIEPSFFISEKLMPDLGDKKIGEKIQSIVNYEVVEKTKSFTILRVSSMYLMPAKRKF